MFKEGPWDQNVAIVIKFVHSKTIHLHCPGSIVTPRDLLIISSYTVVPPYDLFLFCSGDELLLTEMIFNGAFNDLAVEQAVALLSCFVFQEKVGYE